MNGSLPLRKLLPGVHRVTSHSKTSVSEYWYAWRGGPRILRVKARSDDELARLVAKAAPDAILAFKDLSFSGGDTVTLDDLITRYLIALQAMAGAPRTKQDMRGYLDKIREDLGALDIRALESKQARLFLIKWRDRRSATPKTADQLLGALSKVILWAVDRGELSSNPIADVRGLYTPPDRSALIWEAQHLEILFKYATPAFASLVQVAIHTGLRLGDLRRLNWSAVGRDAIVFQTGKSNRKRTVVIPITDPLRAILDALPRYDSVTVLNSFRGRPWSEGGVEGAIQAAKRKALAQAQAERGPDAVTGIQHLRIHDMRGTAATNFMVYGGLEDEDIATILGWKPDAVGEIRRRYISGQAIGLAIVRRMRENRARAEIVKAAVKTACGSPEGTS